MALKDQRLNFDHFKVSFPDDRVVLVTLDRTKKLNCIDKETSRQIAEVWDKFDQDPSLWIGIITGNGRAFCTGADLEEWNKMNEAGIVNDMSAPGLAGLPRRSGKKPIIAAVNGICMGGGFEMVANCDLIIAASTAVFSLPEVKRGIVAVAGALPRLTRVLGLQRTTYLALTGKSVSAKTLYEWGLVNEVVDSATDVTHAAVQLAQDMCKNSPDALIVGRQGIRMSWEMGNVEDAVTSLAQDAYPKLMEGPNFNEGIKAFVEKREPRWTDSKL